ncbi:hypothetical protein BKA69DRAFT_491625 [Paraphysoderma sedebokerense]|nr:hypothetical protein BKA69DRAFT_491625 [Paraphysoderma sedebokerense]
MSDNQIERSLLKFQESMRGFVPGLKQIAKGIALQCAHEILLFKSEAHMTFATPGMEDVEVPSAFTTTTVTHPEKSVTQKYVLNLSPLNLNNSLPSRSASPLSGLRPVASSPSPLFGSPATPESQPGATIRKTQPTSILIDIDPTVFKVLIRGKWTGCQYFKFAENYIQKHVRSLLKSPHTDTSSITVKFDTRYPFMEDPPASALVCVVSNLLDSILCPIIRNAEN